MFITQNDGEIETLFGKKKKAVKKPAKTAKKVAKKPLKSVKKTLSDFAERVKKAKAVIAKGSQANPTKASTKKVSKPKKIKPKAYKVSGSFALDAEGKVLKQTKSIHKITIDKKTIMVDFIVKLK